MSMGSPSEMRVEPHEVLGRLIEDLWNWDINVDPELMVRKTVEQFTLFSGSQTSAQVPMYVEWLWIMSGLKAEAVNLKQCEMLEAVFSDKGEAELRSDQERITAKYDLFSMQFSHSDNIIVVE